MCGFFLYVGLMAEVTTEEKYLWEDKKKAFCKDYKRLKNKKAFMFIDHPSYHDP